MTPVQQQNFNTLCGTILLVLGIIAWGSAAYFGVVPRVKVPPIHAQSYTDLPSCQMALMELGYSVVEHSGEIMVHEELGESPQEQLEKASVAVSLCRLELQSFCMGDACEKPGLTMVLQRKAESATRPTPQ